SGSGEKNILQAVKDGINKINVGCDFMNANVNALKSKLAQDPSMNYYDLVEHVEKESMEIVRHYIRLSGSNNKN
ncbi:MAG: fructose-bisphosphate aldolase, partial [Firmicutes bacterium]|nr:fructose-bisphosphate aldolase [Bacillota bacterium]